MGGEGDDALLQGGQLLKTIKAVERWPHHCHRKLIDNRCWHFVSKPVTHGRKQARRALQHRLDGPVHSISNPSGDPECAGLLDARKPVTDALHPTGDPYQPSLERFTCSLPVHSA